LRVIARSTAFRYKGKEVDPQAVGRELSVRAVLMGKVRQMGNRLNIQVDLVDTLTGAQLWGQEYERQVSDVLSVKQAIAREVTEKLRLRLSGNEQQQLAKRDTTNAEGYQFYLRGRYYWNQRTTDGVRKAIEQFQQAIDRDPNYALGHVGLADSFLLLGNYADVPYSEAMPKARAAADRALQIDESLAEAHTSLAEIHQRQWRWAEAEQEYSRAIALNPNYPTAHHWYSIYFRVKGQFDDAFRESKRAQELDPLSLIINNNLAHAYYLKNDLNSAIEQWQKLFELDPRFPNTPHNSDGSNLRQLTQETGVPTFSVSPDGRWVIYNPFVGGIRKVSVDGGPPVELVAQGDQRNPQISPDGKLLAYFFNDEQTKRPKLVVINAEGGAPVKTFDLPVTSGGIYEGGFSLLYRGFHWSPDGRALVYINTLSGVSNLWRRPLDGGKTVQITDFKSDLIYNFAYAPDGRTLALARGSHTRDAVLISDVK
jgi:tetratricopeptide (TPR) repeat protein